MAGKKRKRRPGTTPKVLRARKKGQKAAPPSAKLAGKIRAQEIVPEPGEPPSESPVEGASWEEIEFEYVTGHRSLQEVAKRHGKHWRTLWRKSKEGGWQEKRVQYMGELRSEARERILRGIADSAVNAFEDFLERLGVTASALLTRLDGELKPGKSPVMEEVTEERDPADGGKWKRVIVKRRPPRLDGPFQRAVLTKYIDALSTVVGIATDGRESLRSGGGGRGRSTVSDAPDELARRTMDAFRAVWATEQGADFEDSDETKPAVEPGKGERGDEPTV